MKKIRRAVQRSARAGRSGKTSVMREVNLSSISTVVNNLEGQPCVFKTLKPQERTLVKTIAGDYPKWWDTKTNKIIPARVTATATRGPTRAGITRGS